MGRRLPRLLLIVTVGGMLVVSSPAAASMPNDPLVKDLWAASNPGGQINGTAAIMGSDLRLVPAWSVSTGSRDVVVAVLDSGLDYSHPDLAGNVWSNPGGIGGCPAGSHGYDVVAADCDPADESTASPQAEDRGHGTAVAGILGAVGDNGRGIAGVNWQTSIMSVRWLATDGSRGLQGSSADLVQAIDWVIAAKDAGVNVRVINDSATFIGDSFSQPLADAIDRAGKKDILFVTAAGNTAENNDAPASPRFPCNYHAITELCVTATDPSDRLSSFANYGAQTVDLAAPGQDIMTTLPGGAYGFVRGGSFAAPQVAGAAALILGTEQMDATTLKDRITSSTQPLDSLAGKVRSGGRLDVCRAIRGCATRPLRVTIGVQRGADVARRGLRVALTAAEPARITLQLTVGRAAARRMGLVPSGTRPVLLGRAVVSVPPSGRLSTRLRLSAATRSALARHPRQAIKVFASGLDGRDTRISASATARLR